MTKWPDIDCGHTCPAKWVHECTLTAGHKGSHRDWTDATWRDVDLEPRKPTKRALAASLEHPPKEEPPHGK